MIAVAVLLALLGLTTARSKARRRRKR
jgi:hypothetical protein